MCTAVTARVRGAYSQTGSTRTQRPGACGFMTAYGVTEYHWQLGRCKRPAEGRVFGSGGSILLNEGFLGRLMNLKIHGWRHCPSPIVTSSLAITMAF